MQVDYVCVCASKINDNLRNLNYDRNPMYPFRPDQRQSQKLLWQALWREAALSHQTWSAASAPQPLKGIAVKSSGPPSHSVDMPSAKLCFQSTFFHFPPLRGPLQARNPASPCGRWVDLQHICLHSDSAFGTFPLLPLSFLSP